ncbi:nuclear factor related to kappa-B-binding protein [Planococcus citri]|uniref:nuclear factor related to kappa-B-binding protein n=1 Tax=Planococcus citri TaxID=170843 RepID=UPI0031F87794
MDDILLQNFPKSSPTSHKRHSLKYEECLINGEKIKLPQALCENTELFQVLFSVDSWNAFTEQQRRHLMQFLPNFEENDAEEKSCTLKLLFSGEEFRFGANPLTEFCDKLNTGFYRSDIVNMQKLVMKARYREYLKKQRIYYYKVLKHSLTMRHKLLENVSDLQRGSTLPSASVGTSPSSLKRKMERISLEKRVKHRYFQELSSIKKEIGDSSDSSYDENYPEGFIPPPFTKKHRKQICVLEESFNEEFEQPTISTLSRPDCLDLSRLVLNVDNPFDMTEDKYKEMVKQYHKYNRNLHPHLKIQKKSKPNKSPVVLKASKEIKPVRRRRTRKPAATATSPKQSPLKSIELIKSESQPIDDNFSSPPVTNSFTFVEVPPAESKFNSVQVKQEVDEFPIVKTEPSISEEVMMKNELAMKEEQDNAVAALLKQEEEEAKVNEYIKNEESKSSVLLFDEFNHHVDVNNDKAQADFLLTPESYNVALHSVVTNDSSSFSKSLSSDKNTPTETPNISEVDNLTFESLSIDQIAETTFASSPSVSSCISTCGNATSTQRISPTVTDLDNMNVMDLGPMNVEENEPPPTRDKPPPELMHNAHTCFFSLIREIVCSTWDHRMDLRNLQKRVDTWYDNAVSPLNSWYTNQSWPSLLQNAVTFLAGQCPDDLLPTDYVPYIDYKANLDIYQWIGAGRDSDAKLMLLCEAWLKNKDEVAARVVEDESIIPFVLREEFDVKREQRSVSPASSRFPTDWVVKPSSFEEKEDFRKQEYHRFQNPNTPFVYRIHGYQTVVGPVNMNHVLPNNAKINKGSSLLIESRPYFVTILALVQDAAARLPNGEGTRQDIVTLLKDSQYLSNNVMNCILHGAVTYALEKLQIESDPCVKYDARRKIWIYLHRSRTISDFEMIEAVKPKISRKTPVWKLRKDFAPVTNVASVKPDFRSTDPINVRVTKEPKANARGPKNAVVKSADAKPVAKRATTAQRNTKDEKTKLPQTAIIQTTIPDTVCQNIDKLADSQIISFQTAAVAEKPRAVVRTPDAKASPKPVAKTVRPSIIKKAIIKEGFTTSPATNNLTKTNIADAKSIIASSSILSPNTIVKLINAKTLTSNEAVKCAKPITQISPQQIVVIKQEDNSDKKHTVVLKQVQPGQTPQQRIALANLQKTQRQQQQKQLEQQLINADTRNCNVVENRSNEVQKVTSDGVEMSKQDLLEKHQKQLQQLLVKHQNELKMQQSGASKDQPVQSVTIQQPKTLPKQMIVIKQNQGQIVAETQNVLNEEESPSQNTKHISASPLVILNKQQYQQQVSNSKHQIIQLSGQQLSTQHIQQLLLKQQQPIKRANPQQQIVMLKPEPQQQGQQQIVMLKQQPQQQQQLVMIKQATQQNQKIQQKQPQPQIIQIANSAGIMTPYSADITKLQAAVSSTSTARLQKIQTSVTPAIIQNSKPVTVLATGTTISVAVSKPSLPTYTVVALNQQPKMFTQNNQNVQILTPAATTVNNNQTVVLPTTSGGALTLLQQTPVQQVLLPSAFNAPGMINLKTLQGLKVIPISAQNAGSLRGQPVITRLVNSNAIRPVVIQEDINSANVSNSNVTHQ